MNNWVEIHIPAYNSDNNPNDEYPWIFSKSSSKEVNSFRNLKLDQINSVL